MSVPWTSFVATADNLYHRVRALFFLSAIYRYHLPRSLPATQTGQIPFGGYEHLLSRRFVEAIDSFLQVAVGDGPSDALASALAEAYHQLGFQTLADQVRRSVRTVRGNQWMFRLGASRRSSAADPPRAAHGRSQQRRDAACCARSPRCEWTFRTVPGATSSFLGWIFPKVPAS